MAWKSEQSKAGLKKGQKEAEKKEAGPKKAGKAGKRNYPPGSILARMMVDIFSNKRRKDVWMLHDKPFGKPLLRLEVEPGTKSLYFVFADARVYFGTPLQDSINAALQTVPTVMLHQMDLEAQKRVKTLVVQVVTRRNLESGWPGPPESIAAFFNDWAR